MSARCSFGLWAVTVMVAALGFSQDSPSLSDAAAPRRDIRIVSGKTIDLSPVHAWYLKREGERPLKHWKKLQVAQMKGQTAGWERCVLKDEDGASLEAFVANLPPTVAKFLQALKQQETTVAAEREKVEAEQVRVRRADALTPQVVITSPNYDSAAVNQRARVNLQIVALQEKQENLARLEAQLDAMKQEQETQTTIFAMAIGKKYANLDVMDCGRLQQP